MTTYTTGPCAAAQSCRAWDRIAQQPGDAEAHALCGACLAAGEFAVKALPRDWLDLEQLLPRPLGVWGDGQPHGHSIPSPLNLAAEALQRAIWWSCTAWEEVARDVDRLSSVPTRRSGSPQSVFRADPGGVVTVTRVHRRWEHPSALSRSLRPGGADVVRACAVLAPRLGRISGVPPVPMINFPLLSTEHADAIGATIWGTATHAAVPGWRAVLDFATLHRRALSMVGLTQPTRRLPGTCPNRTCKRDGELTQNQPRFRGDEPPVVCGWCGSSMTYDDYRRCADDWMVAA